MLSLVRISNPTGASSLDLDEFPYPLQKFDWEYDVTGDDQPKQQSYGRYDTTKRVDVMHVNMEGEIVTDTVAAYWAARMALSNIVVPIPAQTVKKHCRILIELEGLTGTQYFVDLQLQQHSIPIAATGSPTVSPFQFSWTCNKGYWTNAASGALVRL